MSVGKELEAARAVDPAEDRKPRWLLPFAVVLITALHAVLAVTATADKSVTADEIAHLTAGHAYNTRGDFRLHPENGNLPQRLAALPFALAGDPLPPTNRPDWLGSDIWRVGHEFLYESGLPVEERLFAARALMALTGAATALLCFLWSHSFFGNTGGLFSLSLAALCPTLLAHGPLATSDVTMTFLFLASVGAWWRHLLNPGITGAVLSAITFGLGLLAKFSAVLLVPMLGILGLIWLAGEIRRGSGRLAFRRVTLSAVAHLGFAWLLIWAAYGFRFSAFAEPLEGSRFSHDWTWLLVGLGWKADLLGWLREWRLLPEAWTHGLAFVLQFSRARGAFMSGEYSITGWISFFPWAFLIKTPVPLLIILAITATVSLRRTLRGGSKSVRQSLYRFAPLVVLVVVYGAVSLASNLNIGHRHLLPIYPALFIGAGALAPAARRAGRSAMVGLGALLAWQAFESGNIRPHYLAYFNQIVGGPANGWRHLVDSSLDWGQDLPGLRAWLDANARADRVFLAYFGTGDPVHEGIRATSLPTLPEVGEARRWHRLEAGIYAVSATMLQQVYSRHRGPWTAELEAEFQQLRELEPDFLAFQEDPSRREVLLAKAPLEKWRAGWTTFESLRFARLCHYLRLKRPSALIGYSILIFRLDEAEIQAVTRGSVHAWREALEAAASNRAISPRAE